MIEFDEWHEDILDKDGNVLYNDVLFVRASKQVESGLIEYHTPVWDENLKQDAKEILVIKVESHEH